MNQQDNREDNILTKSLADLPLTDEQAEETKAGDGTLRQSSLIYSGESGGINE